MTQQAAHKPFVAHTHGMESFHFQVKLCKPGEMQSEHSVLPSPNCAVECISLIHKMTAGNEPAAVCTTVEKVSLPPFESKRSFSCELYLGNQIV